MNLATECYLLMSNQYPDKAVFRCEGCGKHIFNTVMCTSCLYWKNNKLKGNNDHTRKSRITAIRPEQRN